MEEYNQYNQVPPVNTIGIICHDDFKYIPLLTEALDLAVSLEDNNRFIIFNNVVANKPIRGYAFPKNIQVINSYDLRNPIEVIDFMVVIRAGDDYRIDELILEYSKLNKPMYLINDNTVTREK